MIFDKQTIIVVGASTAIGYLGDALTYSYTLTTASGKPFSWKWPSLESARNLIVIGVLTGFLTDYAIKKISRAAMSKDELALTDLLEAETGKMKSGAYAGMSPMAIKWEKIPQTA